MSWVIYLAGILKSQLPQQLIWSVEMPATRRSFNYRGLLGPGLLWMAQYILCFLLYCGTKSICVNYRRSGTNPEVQRVADPETPRDRVIVTSPETAATAFRP